MKYLFLALICTITGFTATASDTNPINKITATTTVIKASKSENSVTLNLVASKGQTYIMLRKERVYRFTDSCGVTWAIHVFASDGTPNKDMWITAMDFFDNGISYEDGCYHNQP